MNEFSLGKYCACKIHANTLINTRKFVQNKHLNLRTKTEEAQTSVPCARGLIRDFMWVLPHLPSWRQTSAESCGSQLKGKKLRVLVAIITINYFIRIHIAIVRAPAHNNSIILIQDSLNFYFYFFGAELQTSAVLSIFSIGGHSGVFTALRAIYLHFKGNLNKLSQQTPNEATPTPGPRLSGCYCCTTLGRSPIKYCPDDTCW